MPRYIEFALISAITCIKFAYFLDSLEPSPNKVSNYPPKNQTVILNTIQINQHELQPISYLINETVW